MSHPLQRMKDAIAKARMEAGEAPAIPVVSLIPEPRRDTDPDLCHGKIRHRHYRAAVRCMHRQQSHIKHKGKTRGSLTVYRCEECGGWHVGNTMKQRDI